VFEAHYNELLNYLSRQTGDRNSASDLTQETFARVLALGSPNNTSPTVLQSVVRDPRALLFRTAKNLLIDLYRRNGVRKHEDLDDMEFVASDSDNPETSMENRQCMLEILSTIEALPPRCKEAFELYKFDEMPQAEIAIRMGISRNMVEKHVMHGMQACNRCMASMSCPRKP